MIGKMAYHSNRISKKNEIEEGFIDSRNKPPPTPITIKRYPTATVTKTNSTTKKTSTLMNQMLKEAKMKNLPQEVHQKVKRYMKKIPMKNEKLYKRKLIAITKQLLQKWEEEKNLIQEFKNLKNENKTNPKPAVTYKPSIDKSKDDSVDHLRNDFSTVTKDMASTSDTVAVHLRTEEKMKLYIRSGDSSHSFDLWGSLKMKIDNEKYQKIKILLNNKVKKNIELKTHPHIDKELFRSANQIVFSKPFPINADIDVLKWEYRTRNKSSMPLASKL